jgi:hypothetical protein
MSTEAASHPLQNSWVLWEHKQVTRQEDWKNSMREVFEFATIEEFWKYWSYVPRPSEILFDGQTRKEVEGKSIDGFSVFKKGIRPEWEDPENRNGSELTCRKNMSMESLDVNWENLVFALIGETLDDKNEICGCRVVDKSNKKGGNKTMFRMELWLRTASKDVADRIKSKMIDRLAEDDGLKANARLRITDFDFKRRSPAV